MRRVVLMTPANLRNLYKLSKAGEAQVDTMKECVGDRFDEALVGPLHGCDTTAKAMGVEERAIRMLNTLCFGAQGERWSVTRLAPRFRGQSLHSHMAGGGRGLIAATYHHTMANVEAIKATLTPDNSHTILVVGESALLCAIAIMLLAQTGTKALTDDRRLVALELGKGGAIEVELHDDGRVYASIFRQS